MSIYFKYLLCSLVWESSVTQYEEIEFQAMQFAIWGLHNCDFTTEEVWNKQRSDG